MSQKKIVVVTDSTAYLPEEAHNGYHIPTIPLWLLWGEDRFRDGVDIEPQAFYRRLPHVEAHPTTSQPSSGEFMQFFRQVGAEADAIVGIFISSKLSGTVDNALAAKAMMPEFNIRIVDSHSTSMGLGFMVMAAARAAAAGKSADEVVAIAESMRSSMNVLFAVDTLEYLHRGGRIGGAKRFLGTALNIKPILYVDNGSVEALGQARGKRKAIAQMLDYAEEQVNGSCMAEAAVIHMDAAEEAEKLAAKVRERFGISEIPQCTVSPVIGAHTGPGTVGMVFYPKLT
jgi:DegV family protein with EDD domain